MLSRSRIEEAVSEWKRREVTSGRMLGTGIGILVLAVPFSLYFVIVGPTTRDRLVSLAFLVVSAALGVYSLWEAKAPLGGDSGRRPPGP